MYNNSQNLRGIVQNTIFCISGPTNDRVAFRGTDKTILGFLEEIRALQPGFYTNIECLFCVFIKVILRYQQFKHYIL